LTKNEIRLEYSGFVIFTAQLLSVITGLLFQFMIARATTKPEYGIWFNIRDVLTYFTLLAGVLPFWAMRFVARGREGAVKTGVFANLTIAVIATLIYVSLVPLIISALDISGEYLFLYFITAIQVIELYIINVFEPCLQAKKPHVIGYGLLLREICKVVLGYVLINRLFPLYGAMLSVIIAFTLQSIYYLKLLSEDLKQKVRWDYLREWVKGSVVNIYNVVGNQIASFIFIMLFVYGGDVARSDYGVAAQIALIINYSSFLAFALYPKLLAERKREDVTTAMKIVLMFALPMTAGAIVLSDSYLVIFSPVYKEAMPVLVVLAIDSLVATISGIYGTVLLGFEKVDEEAKISFKELVRSRLFIVFSLPYLHSAITIPTIFYALTTYTTYDPVQAALYVGIINSAARFAMFLIQYVIVRKIVRIDIPWLNIAKYVLASSFMAAVLLVIPHPTTISLTLGVTAIGGIIYLSALTSMDKEARILVKNIIQKIKIREFV
jgi:O-antigen/teichoic acid export membrane protein